MKPGYKTTEFWLVVAANLMTMATALSGYMVPEVASIVTASLDGLYALLRTLAKAPEITTLVEHFHEEDDRA